MNNYFIIHGSFGNPHSNWFDWFYQTVSKNDNQVFIPAFPIGVDFQNYGNWKTLLNYYKDLNLINENTVFIGHSIGAVFIVKYLIESNIKVNRIVLIAGFNNYSVDGGIYDTVNKSFFLDDMSLIKNLVNHIICIYSDNDPYVKAESLKTFANAIATEQIEIANGGHMNSEAGYCSFDELLRYI